jgi:hypothetical protein
LDSNTCYGFFKRVLRFPSKIIKGFNNCNGNFQLQLLTVDKILNTSVISLTIKAWKGNYRRWVLSVLLTQLVRRPFTFITQFQRSSITVKIRGKGWPFEGSFAGVVAGLLFYTWKEF